MHPTSDLIFRPAPEQVPELLRALTSPSLSFVAVADAFGTTPSALAAWMHHPANLSEIQALDAVTSLRTQFIARTLLPAALAACSEVIAQFNRSPLPKTSADTSEALKPADPLRAAIIRVRTFESIRKCASFILQLTKPPPQCGLNQTGHVSAAPAESAAPFSTPSHPPRNAVRPTAPVPPAINSAVPDRQCSLDAPATPLASPRNSRAASATASPVLSLRPLISHPLPAFPGSSLDPLPSLSKPRARSSASLLSAAGAPGSEHWP